MRAGAVAVLAAAVAVALAGLAGGASAASPPAVAGTPARLRDFMIQDVCLDATGAVLAGTSPIDGNRRCVATRDLRPGEALPYHKDDHPGTADRGAPLGYQRHDSFPVRTAAYGTIVEDSYDFGTGGGRRFGVFDGGEGDGGDLVLLEPGAVSIAATEDGGAGFQLFAGPHCRGSVTPAALEDSWIIATFDASAPAALRGETVAHLADLHRGHQETCPERLNAAFTRWYTASLRYRAVPGQGKPVTLTTLVSEHYDSADPHKAHSVERFDFTRALGSTRWEAWRRPADPGSRLGALIDGAAARLAASGRCSPAQPPQGGPFVMVDCREWTLIVPSASPSGDLPVFFVRAIRARPALPDFFAAPR
jgi:hypothetical protein